MSFNNYGPAIRDLQSLCAWKLSRARVAYSQGNRGPAQRYTDKHGVAYRPWSGPTGGKWIKGAPVIGAKVKQLSNSSTTKE